MFKYFLILIFFTLISNTQASNKEKIIENLQNTVSLNFQFEQNINGKVENGSEINIFFDNKTFNLVGWQTKDIYQNINVTYLSSIKINQLVDKNLFKLPTQN